MLICTILKSLENSLNEPTSLRAFVQFDSQFAEKVNDIFVTLRWDQPEFTYEIIQGYTMQCFVMEDLKEIQICDDENITTTALEHTVHNLKPNTTYYFRVRAHTEVIAGPYTDFINVSTTHENPIPKLLLKTGARIDIWDLDLNTINNLVNQLDIPVYGVAYWAQEYKIFWTTKNDLMTLDITERNITKIASFDHKLYYLCFDWVARNLYMAYQESGYSFFIKFDLTMWENGIIKFDKIFKTEQGLRIFSVSPSMGILYYTLYDRKNRENVLKKYHLDGKNIQSVQINESSCLFQYITLPRNIIIDNMNNEEPLLYWIDTYYITVTNTNHSCTKSGTLYKFRLILRYPEYEETFTWPTDERFIFSTRGSKRDISDTPGIIANKYYLLYLLLMFAFIVIVTIICLCYFYYSIYRQRRSNDDLTTMADIELRTLHEGSCEYTQFNTIYSPMLHYNPDECAITKIARKQIIFGKIIGSGAFGMVYQGNVKNLESSGTKISVAIKTLRRDASFYEKKKLLKEAELMNRFQHKHILRLLGVCLDGISPFLVLEFMETGDLSKYLRDCRNLEASDSHALRLQDLFAMCEDVARGCCYLEELRFVHRDLACRNCLVSSRNREDRIIKIGDFGLARNIYQTDYYRMRGQNLLPVRWMAPESLMIRLFTSQSDVWSFGVLMWEITSLGEQPYSGKANEEVINYVRTGGRLPMPLNCPSPLYQLMECCWSGAADARPNFESCLNNIITLKACIEDALLSPVDT